jgi:hypothetical protein
MPPKRAFVIEKLENVPKTSTWEIGVSSHPEDNVTAATRCHRFDQAFVIEKLQQGAVCGEIYPGDRVFLRASTGMQLEVQGKAVLAKRTIRGPQQAFTLEAPDNGPGPLRSGTIVYFRAHTGKHVDIFGSVAQARVDQHGGLQAFKVETVHDVV